MQSATLQLGSQGPSVSQLQSRLNVALAGLPRLLVDSRFGMKTQQAVCAFQQRMGLAVTGVVDQKTAAVLGVSLAGSAAGPAAPGAPVPAAGGAVNLSLYGVVADAVIEGFKLVVSPVLAMTGPASALPRAVVGQINEMVNAAFHAFVAGVRSVVKMTVQVGQNAAGIFVQQLRVIFGQAVTAIKFALQRLAAIPAVAAHVVAQFQRAIAGCMSVVESAVAQLRDTAQSAKDVARQIAIGLAANARGIG
ncbi:peptidoglycan-binding protein [Thermomonas sp.]|jgi:peptidoglycan hydrolase-like protein with peptidoglycan-binding domain|uniref:peptidoglycan-binding protein n=1 Tax=Thermomonas sp. TaxID=1971895 RepID=UPI0037849978